MKNSGKVIIVVVTYNRKELLKECIENIEKQYYKNYKILIVDNASTDGTKEMLEEYVKNEKIIYRNTGANLGGAGGFNYGIKEAYKIGCEYIWIMDDDCMVHKDTLTTLLNADKQLKGDYGFLASKVLWKDGKVCRMNVQRKTMMKDVTDFSKKIQKICMSSFVSLFIKSEVVKEMGLPIKEFFIWTDDWEYTRRISRKYKCFLVNDSIVTHKSKNNIGANISKESEDRLERYKYLYRNDVYLYKREGIKGMIYIYIRIIYHIFKVLFSNNKGKMSKIKVIIKNTKDGFKFDPPIEYI